MKNNNVLLTAILIIAVNIFSHGQLTVDPCAPAFDSSKPNYVQGERVSSNGINYEARYWINTPPPGPAWLSLGQCGDISDIIGPPYQGKRRVIGYMPTWQANYNFDEYDPSKVSHVIVSFLDFKPIDFGIVHDNMNYNSSDFVNEIKFSDQSVRAVDSILNHSSTNLYQKSKAANTKVMVAVGGAIDYGFLWLMNRYNNDDAKINEIANLMVDFVNEHNLDGIDLDMECWWADATIQKTQDEGGRIRGNNEGAADQGPHPAAVGITKLAKRLKEIKPDMIVSTVVFGTGWYGNNYDEAMAEYMDWIGIFTYDFTGSWDDTPFGPHGALRKLPLDTYEKQDLDNPIYAAEDVLEYWTGIAAPTWNHDGGFDIERNKLCIGAPFYGYDFSTKKPNGGNGYEFEKYRDIVAKYPNAPTSYDPLSPGAFNGNIKEGGENLFYETPARIREKMKYLYDAGLPGIIIWELTNDLNPNDSNSLLRAVADENNKQCDADANCDNTLSTPNIDLDSEFILFTAGNSVYFDFTQSSKLIKKIQLFDLTGRNVISQDITNKKGSFEVALSEGIYMIATDNVSKLVYIH